MLENDLDRVADQMGEILAVFVGNSHEPNSSFGDSITITKDGWMAGVIRLQRLRDYVEGLAHAHRITERAQP